MERPRSDGTVCEHLAQAVTRGYIGTGISLQWSTIMDNTLVALIVSILLPPLAVYLKKGAGSDLVINIVLCLLMWLPGVLHAIWLTVF